VIKYVTTPQLERWEGFPIGTNSVISEDSCLVIAERLDGCDDEVWQRFWLKLLGHICGIKLTIFYTDAMCRAATPLTYTLGRDYYENEQDQLRLLLGLPSTNEQEKISKVLNRSVKLAAVQSALNAACLSDALTAAAAANPTSTRDSVRAAVTQAVNDALEAQAAAAAVAVDSAKAAADTAAAAAATAVAAAAAAQARVL
jgi:hypothetical protein